MHASENGVLKTPHPIPSVVRGRDEGVGEFHGCTVPLRPAKKVESEGQLRRDKRNPAKAGTSLVAQVLQRRGGIVTSY